MQMAMLLLISAMRAAASRLKRTEDSQITVGIADYTIVVTQTGANPL